MKVAIIHDDLMRRGGAERVALTIQEIFPNAPIYTLCYKPELTYPSFRQKKIITSWFQIFAKNAKIMKWLFFPFGILAMRSLKLKEYDLVIMSTTYCAKYARISKNSKVVAYCYTPFRLAWNPDSYTTYTNSKGLFRFSLNLVIKLLKKIDQHSSKRVDYFLAMTEETKQRLIEAYKPHNPIQIINPSIKVEDYIISKKEKTYYLVVSRFEPYKKVDLVINTFKSNKKNLIIVGRGSQEQKLKNSASDLSNIEFKQDISNDELSFLYQNCKAFIFPQYEDYGLTPIEANAAGRPVIAYAKGGVLDTMVPYQENPDKASAYFFYSQSEESLNNAIKEFEQIEFSSLNCKNNSKRFSDDIFKSKFKEFIKSIL